MPNIVLILYLLIAVSAYAGLYHLMFFFRQKTDVKNLLFSLLCFAQVFYCAAHAKFYSALTIQDALNSIQFVYGVTSILIPLYLWFFYHYTEKSFKKYICYAGSAVFGTFFILSFITSDVTFSLDDVYQKGIQASGLFEGTVYEFAPGFFFQVFPFILFAAILFLFCNILRYYRRRYKSAFKLMPVSFGIVVAVAVYDMLSAVGLINFIYLSEFAYMLIILSMSNRLMTDFIDSQKEVENLNTTLEAKVTKRTQELLDKKNELLESLEKVKLLSGFLPICASCKKIRDDKGYWNQIEQYISDHANVEFSHGICPECSEKSYGKQQWYIKMKKRQMGNPS